jgi:hypothetical protein
MNRTLLALVLAGFAAAPAFAQSGMSCAEFSTLDGDAQADMVGSMAPSGDAMGSMMAGPADDDAAGMMAAPSDDAAGAMMGGDDAAGSMMAGGDDAAGGMMLSEDGGMDNEQTAAMVATLCADHPEMSLGDAMSGANSGGVPPQ